MELDAGEGGEEGGLEGGQPQETRVQEHRPSKTGLKKQWSSETRFPARSQEAGLADWKSSETRLKEQWSEGT